MYWKKNKYTSPINPSHIPATRPHLHVKNIFQGIGIQPIYKEKKIMIVLHTIPSDALVPCIASASAETKDKQFLAILVYF